MLIDSYLDPFPTVVGRNRHCSVDSWQAEFNTTHVFGIEIERDVARVNWGKYDVNRTEEHERLRGQS